MTVIRWGVLGVAAIATGRFIPAMRGATAARLVGIASRSADRAKAAAAEFGIPRHFGSYDALLANPEIDAVYIPLPNHLHVDWAVRALEAGKHVLCEKPLCLTAADVFQLQGARDRSGRHIEEAFSYRNHPQWAKIMDVLTSGTIGAPARRAMHAGEAVPRSRRHPQQPGPGRRRPVRPRLVRDQRVRRRRSAARRRASPRSIANRRGKIDRLSTALLDYGDCHASFTVGTQTGPSAWGAHQQFSALATGGWLRCDFPYAQAGRRRATSMSATTPVPEASQPRRMRSSP